MMDKGMRVTNVFVGKQGRSILCHWSLEIINTIVNAFVTTFVSTVCVCYGITLLSFSFSNE